MNWVQRLALVVALLLGIVVPSAVVGGRGPSQPTAAITLSLGTDRTLQASIRLSRPVTRLELADAPVERSPYIVLQTPGQRLDGSAIVADRPFRQVRMTIAPTTTELDAQYPLWRSFGQGGVLYLPGLQPDDNWRISVRSRLPQGWIQAGAVGAERGLVALVPANLITRRNDHDLIVAPGTPAALADQTSGLLSAQLEDYRRKLGRAVDRRPLAIVEYATADSRGWVGDVTPGNVVYFRFSSPVWLDPPPEARAMLAHFVAHEAFHFWNGGLVRSSETSGWLHEGSAEYAAILEAAREAGNADAVIAMQLEARLRQCQTALERGGHPALDTLASLPQNIRYPCGTIMMWAADLSLQAQAAAAQDFYAGWRAMTDEAFSRPDRVYGVADFERHFRIKSEPTNAYGLLRSGSGPERWSGVLAALEASGAAIAVEPTNRSRRDAVLWHLLQAACPSMGSVGFYSGATTIRLDTQASCGVLSGDPELVSINGHGVGDDMMDASGFAQIQAACANNSPLSVEFAAGRKAEIPCTQPLPEAQRVMSVTSWRAKSGP